MKPANMHLTLRFLGEVDEMQTQRLVETLNEPYTQLASFTLQAKGVGVFPDRRKPRIVWVGASPLETGLYTNQPLSRRAVSSTRIPTGPLESRSIRPLRCS